MVNEPRALTSASVEVFDPVPVAKQFVPSARHTARPFTKMALAFNVEPLALLNPNQEVEVPEAKESVLRVSVVNEALEAKMALLVTAVNVALVPIKFWSEVEPRTVKVEVTVELAPTKPPYN